MKGLGEGIFTTNRSPTFNAPIREFVTAWTFSLVTISNCVRLLELIETTVPSTRSAGEARRGSNSRREEVPSLFNTASTLATWFTATQEKAKVVQVGLEGSGFWSKLVVLVEVASRVPRVADFTVTALPLMAVTTPVKSSIRSSWPLARTEPVRGRVMALSTLVEGVALLRFTLMFPPVIETALLKLKRTLRPCLPLALRVSGKGALEIVAEPAAAGLVVQTAPLRQPETVPAVLFRKVIFGLARATTTLVYVPAGTAVNDPIKADSLCRRMSSTVGRS